MTTRTCERCGEPLNGKATQRYCSEACRRAAKHARWQAKNRSWVAVYNRNYYAWAKGGEGFYTDEEFEAVCAAHDHRCAACGERKPLTADHVVPLSKGGSNWISNIQPLCVRCNSAKKDAVIDFRNGCAGCAVCAEARC